MIFFFYSKPTDYSKELILEYSMLKLIKDEIDLVYIVTSCNDSSIPALFNYLILENQETKLSHNIMKSIQEKDISLKDILNSIFVKAFNNNEEYIEFLINLNKFQEENSEYRILIINLNITNEFSSNNKLNRNKNNSSKLWFANHEILISLKSKNLMIFDIVNIESSIIDKKSEFVQLYNIISIFDNDYLIESTGKYEINQTRAINNDSIVNNVVKENVSLEETEIKKKTVWNFTIDKIYIFETVNPTKLEFKKTNEINRINYTVIEEESKDKIHKNKITEGNYNDLLFNYYFSNHEIDDYNQCLKKNVIINDIINTFQQ